MRMKKLKSWKVIISCITVSATITMGATFADNDIDTLLSNWYNTKSEIIKIVI